MKSLRRKKLSFFCNLLFIFVATSTAMTAALAAAAAMKVAVNKQGDHVSIDVDFHVAASPQQAWEVLTDYDHMSEFLASLQSSHIIARHGAHWQIAQAGSARRGPLAFKFDSVRDIELAPFDRITSRQISGSMKKFEAVTRLSADGDGTRIQYHADSVPDSFIPPIIGPAFIETESRHQFEEMRTEILRRSALTSK